MPGPVYPFTAIVGQDEMKLALLLTIIDPTIGGVMAMGHRGTAKSTIVRALAALLPPQLAVRGCSYGCAPDQPALACENCCTLTGPATIFRPVPVVDLPLGATEDRVTGTLDIEAALLEGRKRFEPGLLAKANRGFLYIDEVNLLDDHLVDLLLDVAASGTNIVEREGMSIRHPARFVLIGSGNPEEGDLRPQLLDRFGLYTQIRTITDLAQRVEIVKRRQAFERDPDSFCACWAPAEEALRRRIATAGRLLASVTISDDLLIQVARLCIDLEIDGHRGELAIARAATAHAALHMQDSVRTEDVRAVAVMALLHRMRKDPLDTGDHTYTITGALAEIFGTEAPVA